MSWPEPGLKSEIPTWGRGLSLILADSEIQLLETSHPAITMFEHCIKAHLSNMKCSAYFLDKGDPLTARSLLLRLLPLLGRYAISAEQCNIVEGLHRHHTPWASLQKQCGLSDRKVSMERGNKVRVEACVSLYISTFSLLCVSQEKMGYSFSCAALHYTFFRV